ncbi:hypothetical protein R0J87_09170 [Halomonas sp. SIMBA_159]
MFKNMTLGSFISAAVLTGCLSQNAWAMTEQDAVQKMYDVAEAAVCNDSMGPEEFKAVRVQEPLDEEVIGSYETEYAVAWHSSLGCDGGRSVTWQVSFVGAGVAELFYVDLTRPPMQIPFLDVTSIELTDYNNLLIMGEAYGPGGSNWDFADKRVVMTQGGEIVSSELMIDGEWVAEEDVI